MYLVLSLIAPAVSQAADAGNGARKLVVNIGPNGAETRLVDSAQITQSSGHFLVQTTHGTAPKPKYREGELIVKFRSGVADTAKQALHQKHGARKIREFRSLRMHHLKVKKGMTTDEAVKLYRKDPAVEYAEPNYFYHTQALPNDPQFGQLWGMTKINAPGAWDKSTGSGDVVVAVIDTGVDYTHPDLQANVWTNPTDLVGGTDEDGNGYVDDLHGINAITGTGDPLDDHGHGTHVSGTIGAAGSNGIGVAGVNWTVKILACKFLDSTGSGTTADAVKCLQYVKGLKDRGVNIVATNNSWGGGEFSQALHDAIAAQQDILFIAAAGNDGSNNDAVASYPAGYELPNIVAVAATDSSDIPATFSNFGKNSVHVAAPGVDIYSTLPAQNSFGVTGGYGTLSGTSMATPHVTGLAALLKAQDPGRDWKKIKNLLLTGGDDVPGLASLSITGKRINAAGSLSCNDNKLFTITAPSYVVSGQSYTISALSINCDVPTGPVTVTTSDGSFLQLNDAGSGPDAVAGDGVFTGTWTAGDSPVLLTFSSPNGTRTISFPPLKAPWYLPDARINSPYSQTVAATGGFPPYTYAISAGSLPAGFSLDPATGRLSGQTAATGVYRLPLTVTDSRGQTASATATLHVVDLPFDQVWGNVISGDVNAAGLSIALDAARNTYVTGALQPYPGTHSSVLLVKYDPNGALVWARTHDSGSEETGHGVVCDPDGNVYVATQELGMVIRGELLKYDPSGNLLWERQFTTPSQGFAGIALDASGTIYTAGSHNGSDGTMRVHLGKYDPSGTTIWSRVVDSAATLEYGNAVAVDAAGNVYYGGMTTTAQTGSFRPFDFLVGKYDPSGTPVWAKTFNSRDANNDQFTVNGVAVDATGNVVATGWTNLGPGETFLLDPAGNRQWTTKTSYFWPEGIAIYGDNIYVVGGGSESVYQTVKFNSSGSEIWKMTLDRWGRSNSCYGVAADYSGFAITGSTLLTGNQAIVSAGYRFPAPNDDLSVTGISGTLDGDQLSYTVKLKNAGTGSPRVRFGLYLSRDAAVSSDDRLVLIADAGTVAGGNEVTRSGTVAIPDVPSGTWYLTAIADPDNAIWESDKSNNSAVGGVVAIGTVGCTFVGDGAGTVTFSPGGACTGNCSKSYAPGTPVTLTAAADSTSSFTGWGGACTGTGLCTVAAADATSVTANFQTKLPLTVTLRGPGLGVVSSLPGGICRGTCRQSYDPGTLVTLTAKPQFGSTFSGWGGACSGTADCTVTMSQAQTVSASFQRAVPSVAPGFFFNLVLRNDQVWSWGDNSYGQLGNGSFNGLFVPPAPVPGMSGVVAIGAGSSHALALKKDGTVWAWGYNSQGELGDGTTISKSSPIQVPGLTGVVAIDCASEHSIALKADGTLWTWGSNYYGELGDGTNVARPVPQQVSGLSGITAISTSGGSTLALKDDGTVWGWGDNSYGQLGDGALFSQKVPVQIPGANGALAVAVGRSHSLALMPDGTVLSWGANSYGQLGDGTQTQNRIPTPVPGLSEVAAIDAGDGFSVVVKTDGTVWTWGDNTYAQIGDGTFTARTTPVQVSGVAQVGVVSAGDNHDLVVQADGSIWLWGFNGKQGDIRSTPARISFDPLTLSGTPPTSVIAGSRYAFTPTAANAESFSITNKPPWATFKTATGALTGNPSRSDIGSISNIVISASNSSGMVSLPPFSITVLRPVPTISGTPPATVTVGSPYSFTPIVSTDATGFRIVNLPSWATFNAYTGALTGTPSSENIGTYPNIVISAGNSTGTASLPAFTIMVVPPMPTISGTPAATVVAGTTYRFTPVSSNAASFSVSNLPSWAAFDTVTGTLSGTPTNAAAGEFDGIVIQATNAAGSVSLAPFSVTVTAAPTVWQSTQGPEGGDVEALLMDPADHQTLYVATGYGGVFKSSDGGASWSMASGGLSGQNVFALALDSASRTILAGSRSGGVFRSSDGGVTWTAANNGLAGNMVQTLVADDRTHTVYAGTFTGLFRSNDGGQSWSPTGGTLADMSIWSISLDPGDSQTLYAGTYTVIYKSSDGGTTWRALAGSPAQVTAAVVDSKNSNVIYAVTAEAPQGSPFIFKSVDGGSSWSGLGGLSGAAVASVAIDPSDSKVLYTATVNGILRSSDSGTTWSQFASGPQWAQVSILLFDSTRAGTMYVGTYRHGLFKSTDGGVSWNNRVSGMVSPRVQAMVVDHSTPAVVYAGTSAGQLYRSLNQGGTWTLLPGLAAAGPISAIAVDPADSKILYVGTQSSSSFYTSVDGGNSWTGSTVPGGAVSAIIPDVSGGTVFIATYDGVYRSADGGASWSPANSGAPSGTPVSSLAIGPDRTLYRLGGGVFKSKDSGTNWSSVSGDLPPMTGGVLAVDSVNGNIVYAGGYGALYRTANGGSSWSQLASEPFTNRLIVALAVVPGDGNTAYVGTFGGGVYRSGDGGVTWSDITSGLYSDANVFAIDPGPGDTVYAGTWNGVYVRSAPVIAGNPALTATVDVSYRFAPSAPAAASFAIANKPSWATFDTATGALSGTPAFADVGSYPNIVVSAVNSSGSSALPAFSIQVVPPLPTISGTPATGAVTGTGYRFTPDATYAVSFSIANKPSWATFDTHTGTLSGVPTVAEVGQYSGITIGVTNSAGSAQLPPFSITVAEPMPTITGHPAETATIGIRYTFAPIVTDAASFTIANKPGWADFDPNRGILSGTPSPYDVGVTDGIVIGAVNSTGTVDLPPFSITVPDTAAPVVSAFTVPATSSTLSVAISSFTATDNVAVSGYLVTESSTPPPATAAVWAGTPPAAYSFATAGTKTLYAWAKDAVGNVSAALTAPVTIKLPIDGVCGTAHRSLLTAAPASGLCATGTASAVSGSGPWSWSCAGIDGGAEAICSAEIKSYTVTFTAGTGGSVSGNPNQVVKHGGTIAPVSAIASRGYHLVNWTGPNGMANSALTFVLAGVTSDLNIKANFQPDVGTTVPITLADALRTLQIATGSVQKTSADDRLDVAPLVNGLPAPDGTIDTGDTIVLLRYLTGLVQW